MLTGKELDILYPYDKPCVVDDKQTREHSYVASDIYRQSLYKQLVNQEIQPDDHLRASLVGKAAIDVVGRKFFSDYYTGVSHPRFYQLFHDGDVWEADYYFWLATRGVDILSTQGEVNFLGVPGHYDFIVRMGDKRVLLELKTANKGYFTSLLKQQDVGGIVDMYGFYRPYFASDMTDFRGHITQISLYREALEVDEAVMVIKCKDTSEMLLYPVPQDTKVLDRVQGLVRAWEQSEQWLDVYKYVGIPEPRKELRQRSHTGRYLVPPKLYGSPIIPLIYEWIAEGTKVIIVGYRLPEGVELPQQLFDKYNELDIYTYSPDDCVTLLDEWQEFNTPDDES